MHSLTRTLVAGHLHKEKHLLRQRLSDQMPDKNAAVDEWSPQASLYTDSLPLNLRKAVNKILLGNACWIRGNSSRHTSIRGETTATRCPCSLAACITSKIISVLPEPVTDQTNVAFFFVDNFLPTLVRFFLKNR